MREDIVFKGINGEVQLYLNETADFESILEQLRLKLLSASSFFNPGTVVKLPPGLGLKSEQKERLTDILSEHGLSCEETKPARREKTVDRSRVKCCGAQVDALVVNKTLRSGQKVVYDNTVVVVGDVNPGAQVVAGGDIIILGACRGMAHAGAQGDQAATITANRILATQLRIAGLIARAPDDLDKSVYVETARIKNGTVIIEPANR